MDDAALLEALSDLGVDAEAYRVLVLLPLVQVAWIDGKLQPRERALIERLAAEHDLVQGPAKEVLHAWLAEAPDARYAARGRRVLAALAHRQHGPGRSLPPESLETVVAWCGEVADVAGGILGLVRRTSPEELAAVDTIARELRLESSKLGAAWGEE